LTRLTHLAINLLENALSYTPAGGTVTVQVGAVDGRATLSVADTGAGIAPEHLPHIFERFYRADRARGRAEGHYGLGLSVCVWIAERHKGRIDVQSAPGRGSTFTFQMPRVRVPVSG